MKKSREEKIQQTEDVVDPPRDNEMKTFLTVPELAKYLRLSVSTVRNRMREGSIPRTKVLGRVLFDLAEVNAWVAAQSKKGCIEQPFSVYERNPGIGRRDPVQPVVFRLD
jgi:excisionase family DNA binding protein